MEEVKILSTAYISEHRYFRAKKDSYQTSTGKIVDPYFFVEIPRSVVAMALTENNEVVLVEQYRHPVKQTLMELPGGFIDDDESIAEAVKRELSEETGYEFSEVHFLGVTSGNPGVLNNYTDMFLLTGGKKVGEQHLDPNEEIQIHLKSIDEVKQMLKDNKIMQSMHALCLFYGFAKLDELVN